ncbi:hypothetical protein BDW02DRAFT_612510 [Decorospora gaudefroyi]|uniref:Uncharacterized protein n=1 Tax=Decorospora gaudefroyi TaxID=184978 RepID=A0A6A5JZR0_9PLEO|nr:hypothetical protein BDW02DRAFT_612510 [Decorospora gaudefroyi]
MVDTIATSLPGRQTRSRTETTCNCELSVQSPRGYTTRIPTAKATRGLQMPTRLSPSFPLLRAGTRRQKYMGRGSAGRDARAPFVGVVELASAVRAGEQERTPNRDTFAHAAFQRHPPTTTSRALNSSRSEVGNLLGFDAASQTLRLIVVGNIDAIVDEKQVVANRTTGQLYPDSGFDEVEGQAAVGEERAHPSCDEASYLVDTNVSPLATCESETPMPGQDHQDSKEGRLDDRPDNSESPGLFRDAFKPCDYNPRSLGSRASKYDSATNIEPSVPN